MKILLLCNKSPWPPKDGGAAATLSIIKGLSDCYASITVLAINTSKHFVGMEEIPEYLHKSTDYHLINIDTRVNPFALFLNLVFSLKPYNIRRFWSRKFNSELKRILENNFDIIQFEGLSTCFYLHTVRQHSSALVVFRPHNIENLIWSRLAAEEKNTLKRLYFRILAKRLKRIEKGVINEFDAIVPISSSDLLWFKTEGLSKSSLLTVPGYDPEKIDDYYDTGTNKVFFIGALDWIPNINGLNWFIQHVWPVVVNRIPPAILFIAGRNPSQKVIKKLIGQNIIIEGEVDSSTDFIKDKTVMVVPLFSGSGIRMKIIEGMSLGKSIVATPAGAEGLDYEDKKNIFIASDASSFAEHIIELLTDPILRSETGKNAIRNVRKNYNILASSENLMNFYRELTA